LLSTEAQKPVSEAPNWQPLIVGISGGSGSGKTTFARRVQQELGESLCGIISQDSYYRDLHEEFDSDGGRVNFDHPGSLEFDLLRRHLLDLKDHREIWIPSYDFVSHRRGAEARLFPVRPVVLVDGILLLSQDLLRPLFDFTIFIETREEVRFERRLIRDVRERGRAPAGVREQFLNHVKPMHDLYVEPSRRFADRVISGEADFAPEIVAFCSACSVK